ncbi:MAG: hypothetical protein IT380_30480 [Myxococcales bacterium]|nr:hypothetical protein [Myxococcales bacterium]
MSYYFDKAFHQVLHSELQAPLVLSAIAHLLRTEGKRLTVERALKHLFISVDEPVTFVTAEGRSFRDFVYQLPRWEGRLSPYVGAIHTDTAHAFDFEPQDFYHRVVLTYDVDWSNFMPYAPKVKRDFLTDDPVERRNFGHLYIAWYDRDGYRDRPGVREALAWLKSIRRYLAQHTVVGRPTPAEPPSLAALEGELLEAMSAVSEALCAHPAVREPGTPFFSWFDELGWLLGPPSQSPQLHPHLLEVLAALRLPAPRLAFLWRIVGMHWLMFTVAPRPSAYEGHRAALEGPLQRLRAATEAALAWAW